MDAELCVSVVVLERNHQVTDVTLLQLPAEENSRVSETVMSLGKSEVTSSHLDVLEAGLDSPSVASTPLLRFLRGLTDTKTT